MTGASRDLLSSKVLLGFNSIKSGKIRRKPASDVSMNKRCRIADECVKFCAQGSTEKGASGGWEKELMVGDNLHLPSFEATGAKSVHLAFTYRTHDIHSGMFSQTWVAVIDNRERMGVCLT